ncbi:hypothetical protein C0J52_20356 [Blattella germanica]|nr:hypothetical protein C0J52_20356 [Blattella germanica]
MLTAAFCFCLLLQGIIVSTEAHPAPADLLPGLPALPLPLSLDTQPILSGGPVGGLVSPVKNLLEGPLAPLESLPVAGGLVKDVLHKK